MRFPLAFGMNDSAWSRCANFWFQSSVQTLPSGLFLIVFFSVLGLFFWGSTDPRHRDRCLSNFVYFSIFILVQNHTCWGPEFNY